MPEILGNASEAIDRELLVLVVSFNERADSVDCKLVLVRFSEGVIDPDVVKRLRVFVETVRLCVIDGSH